METQISALPHDVLHRLPPLSLPAARSVCKPWHAMVDGRVLLPGPVDGIFISYIDQDRPHLFARPAPETTVDGLLDFMPNEPRRDWWSVLDHCNGLLLSATSDGRPSSACAIP